MNDLISRQAAIAAIHNEFDECCVWDASGREIADEVEKILDCVPSAEPKKGKWIDKGKNMMIRWQCPNCGRKDMHIYNYCPDCGIDMREDYGPD